MAHGSASHEPSAQPRAPRGMAYWNVDEMDTVCELPNVHFSNLPEVEHEIHAWERRAKSGHAPQVDLSVQQRSLLGWAKR